MIRTARDEDYPQVFALLRQLWPWLTRDMEIQKQSYLASLDANGEYAICAVEGDRVVGFCAFSQMNSYVCNGSVFYISTLVVDSGCKRQGIGRQLIDKVRAIALEKGVKSIGLDCGPHRKESHAFYQSVGFEKDGLFFSMGVR